jgi:SOS-response transcriptional repressor LexA
MVRIADDSMEGVFKLGDLVLIDKSATPAPGKIVLATAPRTGEYVLRYFSPLHPSDPRAPGFILRAANQSYPEIVTTKQYPGYVFGVARKRVTDL